jgi:hypothetical protein
MRFLPAFLLAALVALPASGKDLFRLTDPRGDDHGDGKLSYPGNADIEPGDLDLVSLAAEGGDGGTWFVASFARPVRVPNRETIDDIGTNLSTVARLGFYTLNLDIYVDVDRKPGSGGVFTLPGRLAEIDPASAWERAIILTPRPSEARAELKRILTRQLNDQMGKEGGEMTEEKAAVIRAQIPGDVEDRLFFPTRVQVRGNTIRFFVPGSFLGGPAQPTWAYTVAVSGANVLQSLDLNRVMGRSPKDDALMILPISPGRWGDRFGGGRDNSPLQPPLVDILAPEGRKQETILSDFGPKKPVVLLGVVPADKP